MSTGRIKLKNTNQGILYDVTITRTDVVGTVYGFPGNGAVTLEQSLAMQLALANAKGSASVPVSRSHTTQNITPNNVRAFLQYQTGNNQEVSLERLQSMWLHNINPDELFVDFHF